jgi:hypothetical protein
MVRNNRMGDCECFSQAPVVDTEQSWHWFVE